MVIRYPRAPSVASLSKTLVLVLISTMKTLPRMSARTYDNIMAKYHFEDAFPPMLNLYKLGFTAQSTQWGHVERGQFT